MNRTAVPLAHHDVRVNGIKTHFVAAGRGEPLVLVHGAEIGTSGAYAWRHNIAALAEHFTVYALDRIGFGASDKPLIAYTDSVMADHLAGFIDALCLDRIYMMGNSMGAYGVAHYAAQHPERVSKMVLVGSGTLGTAMGLAYTPGEGATAMSRVVKDPTRENVERLMETLFENRSEVNDSFMEERLKWITLPGAQHAMQSLHEYRAMANSDANLRQRHSLKHRLPELTIPTILMWGKKDRFAPVALGYELQQALPRLRGFHVLENSGHQAQHDEAETFNERVSSFLRE